MTEFVSGEELLAIIEDGEFITNERIYISGFEQDVISQDITLNFEKENIELAFNLEKGSDLNDGDIVNFKLLVDGENNQTFAFEDSATLSKKIMHKSKFVSDSITQTTEVIILTVYNN